MGWNSTVSLSSVRIQTPSFQFPMGWNSTNFCSISFLFLICFNSQWDGILHRKFNSRGRTMKSFNSQWDGILLICDKSPCLRRKIVSIPNGMEFYRGMEAGTKAHYQFQFPMGWNSTFKRRTKFVISNCFNSQWDGILRGFRAGFSKLKGSFQFPMGWNSTPFQGQK